MPRQSLDLVIDVPAGWESLSEDNQTRVKQAVSAYVEALLRDLDLAASVEIEVSEDDGLRSDVIRIGMVDREFRASIAGLGTPRPEELDWAGAEEVTVNLCRALFRSRTQLIADSLVRRVWDSWEGKALVPDVRARRWLLGQAVRYGFSAGRIREALAAQGSDLRGPAAVRRLFDTALLGSGPGRLGISMSRSLHARLFDAAPSEQRFTSEGTVAEMLDMLAEGLFYESGIRFGVEEVVLDESLPRNTFQFRINAMRLPASRGLAPGEFLVKAAPEAVQALGVPSRAIWNPAGAGAFAVARGGARERKRCEEKGLTTWSAQGYMMLCGVRPSARTWAAS